MTTADHDFNRTVCACQQCTACCKRQPGSLAHGDFERMVEHRERQGFDREVAFEWVKKQLWASPGALVADTSTGEVHRIGTITPRMRKGRCVFLDENERCKIHEVAPFGCSHFDTHQSRSQAHPRSLWLVRSQLTPEYQALRAELPYAQSYKPTKY
jgi:Fe-S-cluster containining protein